MSSFRPLTFVACLVAGFLPGVVGSVYSPRGDAGWYEGLAKSALTPPDIAFPIAWSLLYFLMGCALYALWAQPAGAARTRALTLFAVQHVLNAVWSWLFFGLHRVDLALVEIVLLLAAIALTMRAARDVSKAALWLLAPYLAWVTFATYLNAAIFWLNRG